MTWPRQQSKSGWTLSSIRSDKRHHIIGLKRS